MTYKPFKDLVKILQKNIVQKLIKGVQLSEFDHLMLPVGEYPFEQNPSDENKKRKGIGSFAIPQRFKFLLELKPDRIVRGFCKNRKFSYTGFIFGNIVVADCQGYGNAIYLFRDSPDDQWVEDIEKTKYDLINGESTFIRRMYHAGKWKQRLLDALTAAT